MVFGVSRRSHGSFVSTAIEPISDIRAIPYTHTHYNVVIIIITIIIVRASTARTFVVDARPADTTCKKRFLGPAGKVYYNRYIILVRRTAHDIIPIYYVYHTACIIS